MRRDGGCKEIKRQKEVNEGKENMRRAEGEWYAGVTLVIRGS